MELRTLAHASAVGSALLLSAGPRASVAVAATAQQRPTTMARAPGRDAKAATFVFVTNNDGAVRAFPTSTSGNVAPARTIAGANTGIRFPTGIAVAPDGRLGVANVFNGNGEVHALTFAAKANGNVAPLTAISCGGTTVPLGAAFDSSGNLFITNGKNGDDITVFTPSDNGCVSGNRIITSSSLGFPLGVHVDGTGTIYVASQPGALLVFAPGAAGNATPIATISGSNTGLSAPADVAVDAAGEIIVSDFSNVLIFPANANGNVAPIRIIQGANTGISGANGVAVDAQGNIYVANTGANSVTVYANRANGNAAPIRTIAGSSTGLTAPYKLAVGP